MGDKIDIIADSFGYFHTPDGAVYESEAIAFWEFVFGFCDCGPSEETFSFLQRCLEKYDRKKYGFGEGKGIEAISDLVKAEPEMAAYALSYMFDRAGVTEHGGAVGGDWLTDRGRQMLAIVVPQDEGGA